MSTFDSGVEQDAMADDWASALAEAEASQQSGASQRGLKSSRPCPPTDH